jgi:N-acetylglucosamine-6-phosphate deacetylase
MELHIHGCGEAGVEESVGRPEILEHTARFLSAYGINTFLPTLPCSEDAVEALAGILESNPKLRERIPGIYVEGPFVNPDKRGGISPSLIRKPDLGILDRIIDLGGGYVRLMTVAPELPGANRVIDRLLERGIVPCLGHSDCTAAEALSVMRRAGGRKPARFNVTHLFNGMSGISHKRPGLAAVPFLEEECFFELNGDGIHVADEVLSMVSRHLRKDRMILISDAVVSAGLEYGDYSYFGNQVISDEQGVRYADNGVLIGSNRLIPGVCSHFSRAAGWSAAEVLPLITENPRRLLGLGESCAVRPGMKADLIAIDDSWDVLFNFWGY